MTSWPDKRVLVVDDSQTMRMLLFFHVIKMLPGVKVTEAENWAEALEWLNRERGMLCGANGYIATRSTSASSER